jgi:hypothetical protein
MENLDLDVEFMDLEQMRTEILKLRTAIRTHRDSAGHSLCWYHPELWSLLPDKEMPNPKIPPTGEFLAKCAEYRASLGK